MKNELLVKDVMWKDVDIVDRNLSVQDGLDTMQYKKTKMLIVDKAHENDEYGVVLIADIAAKVIAKNKSLARISSLPVFFLNSINSKTSECQGSK